MSNSIVQITARVLTYNGGKQVIPTLESLKQQTYPYKDLVIADDASTDNGYTVSLIEQWLEENSHYFTSVQFIKNKLNIGIVKNIKKASLYARGDVIFGLGQGDMCYCPDTFELITREIQKHRRTGQEDPYIWLGGYMGYTIDSENKVKEIQLYKDLPFQHKLIKANPYKALKRNLIRWEIGGIGVVYHKKFYDDDVYPLTNAPQNWEDGPTFIWALSEGKNIGILGINIRWYEVGAGISWNKSKTLCQKLQYLTSIILAKKNNNYYRTNCLRYQELCQWIEGLHITNTHIKKIVHRYYKYLSLYISDSIIDRMTFIIIKSYFSMMSSLYKIRTIFYYKFSYKPSEADLDKAMQFAKYILRCEKS